MRFQILVKATPDPAAGVISAAALPKTVGEHPGEAIERMRGRLPTR